MFPASANFESKLSVRALMWSSKNVTPKSSVNMAVTGVPRCTSSNAKTVGLKHLHLSNMAASSGPPDEARIVHHGTDELAACRAEHRSDPHATPVQERNQHLQAQGSFLPNLIDVRRPG